MGNRMLNSFRVGCAGLVFCISFVGCSEAPQGASERVKVFKVKGKVTLLNAPVADAFVSFSPKDSKNPPATGRTNKDGQFTLRTYDEGDGAAAGEYVVLVTRPAAAAAVPANAHMEMMKKGRSGGDASVAAKPASSPTTSGHAETPPVASDVPAQYATADKSDLKVTVKADDSNDFALDLKP
jgi:hypothetical protein